MNVISKADLVDKEELERVLDMDSAAMVSRMGHLAAHGRLQPLTRTIASVVDDYTLVGFLPLDPNDEDSIDAVLTQVDMVRPPCLLVVEGGRRERAGWVYRSTKAHSPLNARMHMPHKHTHADIVDPIWRRPRAAGATR